METVENENRGDFYFNWYIWNSLKETKKVSIAKIETKIDKIQKSVILNTARIFRKVLQV